MKKLIIVAMLLMCSAAVGNATVLTFDELQGQGPLPTNYAGLVWGNGWDHYDFSQDPYNAFSSPERVYNNGGTPSVAFSTATVFDGAYFAGYGTASYSMYLNNSLVHTSGQINLSSTPTWLDSGYGQSVDYVFLNVDQGRFIMDNFTYNESNGNQPVPEPSTFILFGAGLAGVAFLKRRKNNKA